MKKSIEDEAREIATRHYSRGGLPWFNILESTIAGTVCGREFSIEAIDNMRKPELSDSDQVVYDMALDDCVAAIEHLS